MICSWKALLQILPPKIKADADTLGKNDLNELRLRLDAPVEMVLGTASHYTEYSVTQEDIDYIVNCASRYSPWAAASIAKGYLTAMGGHRIGVCGEVVCKDGIVTGIRRICSLCIRIAKDYPGIGIKVMQAQGSVLILGAPGWGKTTLLRDMVRQLSNKECVSVVDERGELFPSGFSVGKRMDILLGAPKTQGIDMVLRSMTPDWIAVDEITAQEDTEAILSAFGCGVKLIATAHASSVHDFSRRSIYQPLIQNRVFETVFVLHPDKTYRVERMGQ